MGFQKCGLPSNILQVIGVSAVNPYLVIPTLTLSVCIQVYSICELEDLVCSNPGFHLKNFAWGGSVTKDENVT